MKPRTAAGRTDRLIAACLNAVYPTECPVCERPSDLHAIAPFCSACWAGIERHRGAMCRRCAQPFDSPYAELCGECMADKRIAIDRAWSFGLYEGALAAAITCLKFGPIRRLAGPLARMLAEVELPDGTDKIEAIVPVPIGREGISRRGFNQSMLLASGLSRMKNIPVRQHLQNARPTRPQIGLSREERINNMKGAFRAEGDVRGKGLLVLDDVITTGATVREAARALKSAGAATVCVLSLARTSGQRPPASDTRHAAPSPWRLS